MGTSTSTKQHDSLVHGGPGDQAGPSADPSNTGAAGSQQGRPQQRDDATAPGRTQGRSTRAAEPRALEPDEQDDRVVSETERKAGSPDDRATTDWSHGEGEPPGRGRLPGA